MAAVDVLADVLAHPEQHTEDERALALEVARYQLRRPMSAEDAAGVLGVSKPTILSWIKAGLLPQADGTRPKRIWLEPAAVFAAKSVLEDARLRGTPAQRVLRLQELSEAVYWATHPQEADELARSIREADEGKFVEVADDAVERARARLARQPAGP